MNEIYLDNSATTKMSERARQKMLSLIDKDYGNPSSLHKMGAEAERLIDTARNIILSSLGILRGTKQELVFTSGGTEANNLAILGTVFAKKRQGNEKILTTMGEHASVAEPLRFLEGLGYNVIYVPTKNGELDLDFIKRNAQGAILATFMHVNNETGALYNLKDAFSLVRELSPNAVLHADCVQSYLKVRVTKKSLGADLITVSAHKVNGPKGVGALYVAPEITKAKRLVPVLLGGGQELGVRSGTENTYGIVAFGEAVVEKHSSLGEITSYLTSLRDKLTCELSKIDGLRVNLPSERAPHIVSVTVLGIKSETVLHFLSSKGIYVSSGSACSSNGAKRVSPALLGFGLAVDEIDSTIRISFSCENTESDIFALRDALCEAVSRLARK